MPYLSPDQRHQLLGPLPGECPRCRSIRIRHYCRSCDEFFLACGCNSCDEIHAPQTVHLDHRVYLWTPSGVRAIPDFD